MAQESFEERTRAARDYLDGNLDVPLPEITYDGDPIRIRLSSFVPKSTGLWKVWEPAFEQLERESNGKLTVRAYPGGVLHAMADGFTAVRDGISDLSHCYIRSEEHTSELQSLVRISYAVFCLKTKEINDKHTITT